MWVKMIHYIKGVITETMPDMVVIENGGIGYEVNVPSNSPALLSRDAEPVTLYTAMLVREDDISLYGFSDTKSLAMFHTLTSVSGVGAKGAMAILSVLEAAELRRAILFEDTALITKANGIGKKTAQRIILELKDKMGRADELTEFAASSEPAAGSEKEAAVQALISLGFSKSEAMSAMLGINEKDLSAQEYIKRALKNRR